MGLSSTLALASSRTKKKLCGYNSACAAATLRLRDRADARAPDQRPPPAPPPVGRARSPRALLPARRRRSEEHTSELQSQSNLVCRLLLEKKKKKKKHHTQTQKCDHVTRCRHNS